MRRMLKPAPEFFDRCERRGVSSHQIGNASDGVEHRRVVHLFLTAAGYSLNHHSTDYKSRTFGATGCVLPALSPNQLAPWSGRAPTLGDGIEMDAGG